MNTHNNLEMSNYMNDKHELPGGASRALWTMARLSLKAPFKVMDREPYGDQFEGWSSGFIHSVSVPNNILRGGGRDDGISELFCITDIRDAVGGMIGVIVKPHVFRPALTGYQLMAVAAYHHLESMLMDTDIRAIATLLNYWFLNSDSPYRIRPVPPHRDSARAAGSVTHRLQ
jgi:hypothetical protein